MSKSDVELRVDAHVLVQLGSELVTDVEQAILECVKNAYDADSPGCRIEIDTQEKGVETGEGPAASLKHFSAASESVKVTFAAGRSKGTILRHLNYAGRITIEDHGFGLSREQLEKSWLVISKSDKRSAPGSAKIKTPSGRTPLGDKGLGRLGSMKLGDILRIETATDPNKSLWSSHFRWADCDAAGTIDKIPVSLEERRNDKQFKGTRVSVLGLKDIGEWRRPGRINEITRSLAKLISPFEATSTFPVGVVLDGVEQSLVAVTDELLGRAMAEFKFEWRHDLAAKSSVLEVEGRIRKRLLMSTRSKNLEERTAIAFESDGGKKFAEYLLTHKRFKNLQPAVDLDGAWFIKVKRRYRWEDIIPDTGALATDPGPFEGAFYYFHLENAPDEVAAAGVPIDRLLIKSMSGISILRDGFRIRSHGDWLDLSSGMTSGSTYSLRVENTLGYFALTGEKNHHLVEKSDREGFVEDSAFRGFMAIAKASRDFANDIMVGIRRVLIDYAKSQEGLDELKREKTITKTFGDIEDNLRSTKGARAAAEDAAKNLQAKVAEFEEEVKSAPPEKAIAKAKQLASIAARAVQTVKSSLPTGSSEMDLRRIQQELDERNEQAIALLEGAAVGLSARGIAHELRTHLTEIRQQTAAIERASKGSAVRYDALAPHLRRIKAACGAISGAAALIDPMLPKARALRETIELRNFVEGYISDRSSIFDRRGVKPIVSGSGITIRANRTRLVQVVDNLVQNSFYWMFRSDAPVKEIRFTLTRGGLTISDSGPGVDPHFEESLFEIFVSAKPGRDRGQGLGLFIAQQLLHLDGCEITLLGDRNAEGRRYKFAIDLSKIAKS